MLPFVGTQVKLVFSQDPATGPYRKAE